MTDLSRAVTRRIRAEYHYRSKARRIVVSLCPSKPSDPLEFVSEDLIVFRLQGCRFTLKLRLRDVFLEGVRADGSKVPRVLKGKKRAKAAKPYKHTQATYAKRYGVPKRLVKDWWKKRAPLDNPDAMGERLHAAIGK